MPQTVNHHGPMYIRLGRGGDPVVSLRKKKTIGQVDVMRSVESDVVFISTGTATQCAVNASIFLRSMGMDSSVIHCPTLKPLGADALRPWLRPLTITVEDHSIIGGLGSVVAEQMAESGYPGRLRRFGYPDVFPHGYGTQDELRARYGLTADAIVAAVKKDTWAAA